MTPSRRCASLGPRRIRFPGAQTRRWRVCPCGISQPFAPILLAGKAARPPSSGRRILRFFVNVHASEPRVWKTGPAFPELARTWAGPSGLLERYRRQAAQPRWRGALSDGLGRLGLAHHFRPPYDRFMLSFHDWLKANQVGAGPSAPAARVPLVLARTWGPRGPKSALRFAGIPGVAPSPPSSPWRVGCA